MTAGIVTYRLCDRDYDCENCPLFQALREVRKPRREIVAPGSLRVNVSEKLSQLCAGDPALLRLLSPLADVSLPGHLYYGPGRTWVEIRRIGLCRIGLDGLLARALPWVDSVVPPEAGRRVGRGDPLAWLIVAGEMLPVRAPLSASVVRVNPEVLSNPFLLREDAYGTGWLVEVEAERLPEEVRDLRYGREALESFGCSVLTLCQALAGELRQGTAAVGPLSQDGGSAVSSPADALGVRRYLKIIHRVLLESPEGETS
ncbi:MAG: hypothetical protein ONB23_07040 [candidate division KSB1 bacterium]|nr:hypothetical protein [candidate division KSB1 bacterium]